MKEETWEKIVVPPNGITPNKLNWDDEGVADALNKHVQLPTPGTFSCKLQYAPDAIGLLKDHFSIPQINEAHPVNEITITFSDGTSYTRRGYTGELEYKHVPANRWNRIKAWLYSFRILRWVGRWFPVDLVWEVTIPIHFVDEKNDA